MISWSNPRSAHTRIQVNQAQHSHRTRTRLYLRKSDEHEAATGMGECVHHIALSRLYWGPNRLISCPRMTKFAATRGVGAMIVVDILS